MKSGKRSLVVGVVAAAQLMLAAASGAQTAGTADQQRYLGLAANGISHAHSWWDPFSGWYYARLGGPGSQPLATIWDAVPLFESIDEVALADPSAANKRAVKRFAIGAERYWDPALGTHGGFAPYPGSHGRPLTWFDDNGWWGLAFLDAYQATGIHQFLRYAQRAFDYVMSSGWDPAGGGLWWNTNHPYKAGESLAAATWLAAQLYRITLAPRYLAYAGVLTDWGQTHLWNAKYGLYARSNSDPTPLAYVQGPMIAADDALCSATAIQYWCDQNDALLDRTLQYFRTLKMGPQFDAIYLRSLLYDYSDTLDPRIYALATSFATRALTAAADSNGLYLNAWDGSSIALHNGVPGMLQTHAATVSLLADLAVNGPPPPG